MPSSEREEFAIPFVKAVVLLGGRFLLQRRAKEGDPYEGFWELPGGRMRRTETAERALAREVEEEAGLRLVEILGQGDETLTDEYGRSARLLAPLVTVEVSSGPWPFLGLYFACRATGEASDSAEGKGHRLVTPGEFAAEFVSEGATGRCATLDLLAMRIVLKNNSLDRFIKADS